MTGDSVSIQMTGDGGVACAITARAAAAAGRSRQLVSRRYAARVVDADRCARRLDPTIPKLTNACRRSFYLSTPLRDL